MEELLERLKLEYKPAEDCTPSDNEPDYIKYGRLLHFFVCASREQLIEYLEGNTEEQIEEFVKVVRKRTNDSFYLEGQRINKENKQLIKTQNAFSFAKQESAGIDADMYAQAGKLIDTLRTRSDRESSSLHWGKRYYPWICEIAKVIERYAGRITMGVDVIKRMSAPAVVTLKKLNDGKRAIVVANAVGCCDNLNCCSDSD